MSKKKIPENEPIPRYETVCPVCNATFHFQPSIAMRDFGMVDSGHGRCLKCQTFLHLEIDPTVYLKGKAEKWDDWILRTKPPEIS